MTESLHGQDVELGEPDAVLDRDVEETAAEADAGVVDEHLDRPVRVGQPSGDECAPRLRTQIGRQGLDLNAVLSRKLLRRLLKPIGVAGDQDQVVLFERKPARERGAEAGGRAGDEGSWHERTLTSATPLHPGRGVHQARTFALVHNNATVWKIPWGAVSAAIIAVSLAGCGFVKTGENEAAGFFTRAPAVTPTFALTPSYLPPGVETAADLNFLGGDNDIRYADYGIKIRLVTGSARFDTSDTIFWDTDRPATTVQVAGKPGKLIVDNNTPDAGAVTWERKPGQWVVVLAPVGITNLRATLLRVAEGLRDQQQTGKASFKVAEAPVGYELLAVDSDSLRFGRPGSDTAWASVSVTNPISDNDIGDDTVDAEKVKVGKLSGWLQDKDGVLRMTLVVSDGIWLSIHSPAKSPWNENRLRRFAAGVEYVGPMPLGN